MDALKKSESFAGPAGPVVLLIMDGVGIGKYTEGDMVLAADTPQLDWLKDNAFYSQLKAHGLAVGLPSDDDMGNSEVGHNAIGCGRVLAQGAALVNRAIASGSLFEGEAWLELIQQCKERDSTLHFIGLLSDGNVHSHIDQLAGLLKAAAGAGVKKVRVHPLLDGRDVPPVSCLKYVDQLEEILADLNSEFATDYRIASGGGRMQVTMDRYDADWRIVERGWKAHVKGEGRLFASAKEAVETFRKETPGILDQDLPPFVIGEQDQPCGLVQDGDSVVFFNFRGDRAIEISRTLTEKEFTEFDRGPLPDIKFAGMMQYDGDKHIPARFLVNPPAIDRTLGEYLVKSGVSQLAISETQKFGHVTYFFNGNRSGKFDDALEKYVEIPSDLVPFEERPWMKASEITDHVVDAIMKKEFRFIRLNYPNGDMVGHTGVPQAVRIAVEAVDLNLARVIKAIKATGGILIVSADHGNADDMYAHDKKSGEVSMDPETGLPEAKTSHSLNPVPVYIFAPADSGNLRLNEVKNAGIASLAATSMQLLGFVPPDDYEPSLIG